MMGQSEPLLSCEIIDALRFTSLAVTSSREDFHLQVDAHAGRTNAKPRARARGFVFISSADQNRLKIGPENL